MECLRDHFSGGITLGGRYQTMAPLNHGSFGMVFMARDVHSGQTVAIKCLTKPSAADVAGRDFAIDDKSEELDLHRQLSSHPNIVNLLDSFETDAHIYLVLEFCSRGDLYEAIRNGQGPLETEHVRRFMLELVDAVAYIHSKGIYHRDIKPENIFLTQSGVVKLGDFGLSTTDVWTHETTVGSDRYMSPEQFDSADAGYSPAQADIWAVGICLLNILFSRNPFTAPTEADPLFLDFSRDKQSLFDVFPSMSQDTYEVIVECMNLDPRKRSLVGAREALSRVVSFTTLDEALDDFCSAERRTVATANREPLRTPSIQSPHVDSGAFPWAKALQASSPQHIRKLSAIPDNEGSYTEELFSMSSATTDWFSGAPQTPSLASVLESSLGASMNSLATGGPPAKVSRMAGSLPIRMSRPRNASAMSLVFGRKDTVSKSWSDMWDEDAEEAEQEKLQALKQINSRTWSHESRTNDDTPRGGLSPATKCTVLGGAPDVPAIASAMVNDIDGDLVADGFFFHDDPVVVSNTAHLLGQQPSPTKREESTLDKWAALGERRRAFTGTVSSATRGSGLSPRTGRPIVGASVGQNSFANGILDHNTAPAHHNYALHNTVNFVNLGHGKWGNTPTINNINKDRVKECPWNKGRDQDWSWNWRKEKRSDFGDMEWVGGWQEAHILSS